MKTTELICARCGKQFTKRYNEYARQIRRGRHLERFFCSLACAGFDRDELSPFRYYINNCKRNSRKRGIEFNLTVEYIQRLWKHQKGICPYLRIEMFLDAVGHVRHTSPCSASLDRIDSNRGYIEGNVEWICLFVNLGKNGFSKEQIQNLLGLWQRSNAPHSQ